MLLNSQSNLKTENFLRVMQTQNTGIRPQISNHMTHLQIEQFDLHKSFNQLEFILYGIFAQVKLT